jgi:hypothetical protein
MSKKLAKATIVKAHKIARAVRGEVRNPYAVGMAQAKRSAAKRRTR